MDNTMTIDQIWEMENQSLLILKLKQGNSLQSIFHDHKEFLHEANKFRLSCCDGRIYHNSSEYNLAGSGILLSEIELEKVMKSLQGKITTLTSHEGCGAVVLAFKLQTEAGNLASEITSPDLYAQNWTETVAKKYGFTYEHISAQEFNYPEHHEMGLCLDGTGKLNLEAEGLPNMFISHSFMLNKDEKYIATEAEILAGIAFGDHGFGNRFTEKDPFQILVIVGSDKEKLRAIKLMEGVRQKYGHRVQIQSAIVA